MRKFLAIASLSLIGFAACGGDEQAAPSPAPTSTHEITGRIMGPAGDAQDTVDRLNDRQNSYGE